MSKPKTKEEILQKIAQIERNPKPYSGFKIAILKVELLELEFIQACDRVIHSAKHLK